MALRADKHQRILAELLTRPGNDICADCRSRAPRWAAWNIGVFLCVHCASIHRKMGTHISKVVTLDTWTKEQVESMKTMGNLNANQIFNPNERRHPPPPDSDENDRGSDMEKFIRNKYQYKQFMASVPATSPPSAPPPVPKDPVPGRSGGASLGSQSDVEDVIQLRRAPSRAKSTPIVSSKSSSHSQNVLSSFNPPPASSSTSSRAPVFGSGNLPYRPSTASALEPPPPSQRANSSKSQTYPQPVPIPPDPSPQPYNNQPRLQYASQVSPGPTNPLWQDMMSLSLSPGVTSPSTSSTSGSVFSSPSYANGSSFEPSAIRSWCVSE
ncbi:hypothetical protein BS47DRAFT_732405 [Hydnum rufescens UP504]|uniref:Arf-GAP domain-containing protein n=1 Tax=Hydnum rufescens UP504 TaxID=1448309 RepID=A0A9P6B1H0_9AGAM|nr:hypothetical protein BS47DRAFT_732405 [Hydnum rufescens UP504]